MSDELRTPDSEDLSADTERFRRFARQDGEVTSGREQSPFRLLTLVAGLLVLALVIWLLLR